MNSMALRLYFTWLRIFVFDVFVYKYNKDSMNQLIKEPIFTCAGVQPRTRAGPRAVARARVRRSSGDAPQRAPVAKATRHRP